MTHEKRFTDVQYDYENNWITLKDRGYFMIFEIDENDYMETLEDLLNYLNCEKYEERIRRVFKKELHIYQECKKYEPDNPLWDKMIREIKKLSEQLWIDEYEGEE